MSGERISRRVQEELKQLGARRSKKRRHSGIPTLCTARQLRHPHQHATHTSAHDQRTSMHLVNVMLTSIHGPMKHCYGPMKAMIQRSKHSLT